MFTAIDISQRITELLAKNEEAAYQEALDLVAATIARNENINAERRFFPGKEIADYQRLRHKVADAFSKYLINKARQCRTNVGETANLGELERELQYAGEFVAKARTLSPRGIEIKQVHDDLTQKLGQVRLFRQGEKALAAKRLATARPMAFG